MSSRRKSIVLGRMIRVKPQRRTLRDIMREHYREAGLKQKHVAALLAMTPGGFRKWLNSDYQTPPQYIDAFIEALKLDEFDALELRLQGAIEMGWQLDALKPALKLS